MFNCCLQSDSTKNVKETPENISNKTEFLLFNMFLYKHREFIFVDGKFYVFHNINDCIRLNLETFVHIPKNKLSNGNYIVFLVENGPKPSNKFEYTEETKNGIIFFYKLSEYKKAPKEEIPGESFNPDNLDTDTLNFLHTEFYDANICKTIFLNYMMDNILPESRSEVLIYNRKMYILVENGDYLFYNLQIYSNIPDGTYVLTSIPHNHGIQSNLEIVRKLRKYKKFYDAFFVLSYPTFYYVLIFRK